MANIIEAVTGDLSQKRYFRAIQKRAKALPADYRFAYDEIQKYVWTVVGTASIGSFAALVELFEEGAAQGRPVLDITGPDVAAFADDLVKDDPGYRDQRRAKLNQTLAARLGPGATK